MAVSKKEIEQAGLRYVKRKYGHRNQDEEFAFEAGAAWYKNKLRKNRAKSKDISSLAG